MANRLKELLSDSAVYGLSSVVARFLNYLLVPFYTGFFAPSEYGIIGLIYAAMVFLNVIFTFGMESSYIRHATDRNQSQDVFKTLQSALILVGSVLALLMISGSGWLMPLMSLEGPHSHTIFFLLIGILWFDALGIVPYAELRLLQKSWVYAGIRIINVLINLGLNIWLVAGLGWGIEAVLWSNFAASAITTLVLWIITRKQLSGEFRMALLQQALVFGLPYVPNGIGFAINEVIDRFFLNAMSGDDIFRIYQTEYSPEDVTGIYNACYKLAIFMLLTVQMFRMAWQPFFMKYAKDLDNKVLFSQVFDWFNIFCAIIFLGVSLFVAEIAALHVPVLNGTLIDSRYWAGLGIVPVLTLAYWFQGWFVNFSAGIFIKDQTSKLPLITAIGSIITIGLNFALVPWLGMMGSAIATLSCYAVMSLVLLRYSRKAVDVPYRIGRALIIMAFCAFFVWLCTESGIPSVTSFPVRLLTFIIGGVFVFSFVRPKHTNQ